MDVLLAERYQTTTLLGVGGAASVYRAVDRNLGRDVAIKLFNPTMSDDDEYRRQHTETMLLSTLNHPGLVALHDAGMYEDADGRASGFLVMELIDGEDLRKLLKKSPLQAAEVAQVGADLADALAYIHSQGVVHRDVKPANILMFHSGDNGDNDTRMYPKLTDFGIARMVDATMATAAGATIGTANYLSPEQAQGIAVEGSSDIYSLGLVLLECLTGEKAFPGPIVEAALARLLRDPVVPLWLGPDWVGLLKLMTARDPLVRPSAHEVALLLRTHSDDGSAFSVVGLPPESAPSTAPAVVRPPHGRQPGESGNTGEIPTGGMITGGVTNGNVHIPAPPSRSPSLG
ncbi:serine/threonine-protein kinase [Arthrobacter sp. Br18]|uniref:serine/threonine-protein kinase n=1 Tax=Arthrobacter sp. Br18 TaxID=1312954 RepID=UPI00047C01BB|nr:serine/threonine-protein kinase [Arthrobacter sp. Br18]